MLWSTKALLYLFTMRTRGQNKQDMLIYSCSVPDKRQDRLFMILQRPSKCSVNPLNRIYEYISDLTKGDAALLLFIRFTASAVACWNSACALGGCCLCTVIKSFIYSLIDDCVAEPWYRCVAHHKHISRASLLSGIQGCPFAKVFKRWNWQMREHFNWVEQYLWRENWRCLKRAPFVLHYTLYTDSYSPSTQEHKLRFSK